MRRKAMETDLLCKKGHHSEDNQRHQDTVGPELELVAIHAPEEQNISVNLISICVTSLNTETCASSGGRRMAARLG